MRNLAIVAGSLCMCLNNVFSMDAVMSSLDRSAAFGEWGETSFDVSAMDKRVTYSMTAEKCLEECRKKIRNGEFDNAVSLFKSALIAKGDQACFFFGDIVRLLIEQKNVNFEINELYEDYGITDKAKRELRALNAQSLISAFRTYLETRIMD